jgi:hypothetical protein
MPDEKKSSLDALVELALFAPLGLALTARDHLPDLIARGRQQVTSQVNLARMMGQYAVREGEKDVRRRLDDVGETLAGLGLRAQPPAPAASAPAAATVPAPPPEAPDGGGVPGVGGNVAAASPNGSSNGKATAPARSRADLSIPGYDTLSASQVVQRLAGLTAEELEAVRDYEAGTRGRRTILSKIAQLQGGSAPA